MKTPLTEQDIERASKRMGNSWPMSFKLMLGWMSVLASVVVYQARQNIVLNNKLENIIQKHVADLEAERESENKNAE